MGDVFITGIGQVPVGEHWEISLRSLAARAMLAALHQAEGVRPQALFVGNLLGPVLSHQANLATLLIDNAGLDGIEGHLVEAGEASGAAALRMAFLAVASGWVESAMVVGVEKVTDHIGAGVELALAETADSDYETAQGLTLSGLAGLVMQRYLYAYGVERQALGVFPVLMHANAVNNPNAMYRKAIRREAYARANDTRDAIGLLDMASYADGAAAVLLSSRAALPANFAQPLVRISGSSLVTDRLALHDRSNPLGFDAARLSVERACRMAGILPGEVDFFELSDTFSIYAALSLEAAGFAPAGQAAQLAEQGEFSLGGRMPINTLGGMKGRGNPAGAAGVYQIVEAVLQLRGQAGANQINSAQRALVQSLSGPASTAVTHVLERIS
jgi:acetyl-CoA C-acetyltransferase